MRSQFTSYEQLPITLTADHVAAALGISRANAYVLITTRLRSWMRSLLRSVKQSRLIRSTSG